MANTLNGLSLTQIAQETLPVLQPKVPVFDLFSTDLSPEVSIVGAGISTRIPATVTASSFVKANGYASTDVTTTAVTVNLTAHKHFTMGFTDLEVSTLGIDKLQSAFIQPAINSIVNSVQTDLFALITSGNYSATSYSASYANYSFNALVQGQKPLDVSGSSATRCAILNAPLTYALLGDIKSNSVLGDSTAIRQGLIGELGGLKVASAPLIGAGTGLAGIIAGKDCMALAARVPSLSSTNNFVDVANVTAGNGFTIQLRQWYSPDLGQWKISAVVIYGVAVGQGSSLVRVITVD